MPEGIERVGNSLLNLVLGGVILWVGQTTFRHSGILATVDEKFQSVNQKFGDVDRREEDLRKTVDSAIADWKDTTHYLFTTKDGDKVVTQVRNVESTTTELERRLVERLGAIEARIAAIETGHHSSQEVASLQWEVANLRDALTRTAPTAVAQEPVYQQPAVEVARGVPVYLPPTGVRR
jgi:phage FluMu protein gp41